MTPKKYEHEFVIKIKTHSWLIDTEQEAISYINRALQGMMTAESIPQDQQV